MGDVDAEILLEMNRIGPAMEVRAISAGDGLEVSFTAPASAAQSDIERLARQKLAYVRSRPQESGGKRPDGKGGIVV